MKRIISIILITVMLLVPATAFTTDLTDEQAIKKLVKEYFDLKYKMLSTLTFDQQVSNFIFPDVLVTKEAINETDIINVMIKYRKMQINDLEFDRYKFNLVYGSIKVEGDKAWATFTEDSELYFKCAPTVKNTSQISHVMLLKKKNGNWFVASDDYEDADGIKKKLSKYFMEDNMSKESAKNKVLKESENYMNGRLSMLDGLAGGLKDKGAMVLHVGKSIAYAGGKSGRIDNGKNIMPVLHDKTVFLPINEIFRKIGSSVGWQDKVTVKVLFSNGKQVRLKMNSNVMYITESKSTYEKKVTIKSPPRIIEGTAMLSIENFAQITGKKLFFDGKGLVIFTDGTFDKNKNANLIGKLQEFFSVLFTKTDFPRIDGSTATYPFSIEMGKVLLGLDDTGAKGFITHNTTHNAYVNLINKTTDIIFVTEPSQDEYNLAKQKGIELEVIPMCREGFVFLVNKDNPVSNLTVKQIQDIYQGKIKYWKDVGGEDREIIPYQREANSGSQTLMENTVMKGLKLMEAPKETIVFGMGGLIDRVADYSNAKNALGYSVYYYATTMYTSRNIKLISVNGVAPNKQTIKNGKYPFTVGYYAVLRKSEPKDSNARKLLKWVLGEEGQSIVDKAGFVSIR